MTSSNGTYPTEQPVEPPQAWRAILEIVQALALAAVIAVVLNLFVVQVFEPQQRSMEPTLFQSDRVIVSKVDYRIGRPAACDIVVFNPPNGSTIPYVKRVIAVAGEKIELRDGKVIVNGQARDCAGAHDASTPQAPSIVYPFTVPAGHVWVMGDNRLASSDSRSFGPITADSIIGKVVLRFWPFDHMRFFEW